MSDINHRRPHKRRQHRDKSMSNYHRMSEFSDVSVDAGIPNDFTDGHRGMARAVKGAKKFVRSRVRFHDKQRLAEIIKGMYDE